MTKKVTKKTNKKKCKPSVTSWNKLNKTSTMLKDFSRFLLSIEQHRTAPKYSKDLVKSIFETWATAAAKDDQQKHQANLIKGFADFLK